MYFNNAATTWPKPEVVYETLDRTFRSLNSPERTTSDEGARSDEMMSSCREELAAFFNIKDPRRLIFTPSATYSLNLAILGLDWRDGDVMLMSGLEHHAVSRPIRKVAREHGARFEVAPYSPQQPIDLNFVEDKLKAGNVKLLAFAGHKGLFGPPGGGGLFVRKGIQLETLAEVPRLEGQLDWVV